jgi:hypothetical protein
LDVVQLILAEGKRLGNAGFNQLQSIPWNLRDLGMKVIMDDLLVEWW